MQKLEHILTLHGVTLIVSGVWNIAVSANTSKKLLCVLLLCRKPHVVIYVCNQIIYEMNEGMESPSD